MLRLIVREPLVHFLLVGALIFAIYGVLAPDAYRDEDPRRIVVDEAALLTFVQYRTKAFEPAMARKRLEALSETEYELLLKDYIREEALHREALALGLDRNDYIIRRRLVQKLEFVGRGIAEAATSPAPGAVENWYETHADEYYVEPSLTFTHIFFDAEITGMTAAMSRAEAQLKAFASPPPIFSDAPGFGDRFPYHVNYVDRTPDYVASHFGQKMTDQITNLEPRDDMWRGPYQSEFGAHLVMLIKKAPGYLPPLDNVYSQVERDMRQAEIRKNTDAAIEFIVELYDVELRYTHPSETPGQ